MSERNGRSKRQPAAVARFIERFASGLVEAGMARMPARIFAALLATDAGRLTAAELAELLHVSPAAVSGAIRYLTQLSMVTREREPGSRREHYALYDDVWYEAGIRRDQLLARWEASARVGVDVLGRDTPAGARMAETLAYIEFVDEELPKLLKRWRERKAELGFT
ncbi:MAG: GbsR/MarR family transcriptional regulator [Acidimicrobiales bacterium]